MLPKLQNPTRRHSNLPYTQVLTHKRVLHNVKAAVEESPSFILVPAPYVRLQKPQTITIALFYVAEVSTLFSPRCILILLIHTSIIAFDFESGIYASMRLC